MDSLTRTKIIDAINAAWQAMAKPLGRDELTYSEGIEVLCSHFAPGRIPVEYASATARSLLPENVRDAIPDNDIYLKVLESVNNEEKLQSLLKEEPEPTPQDVQMLLKVIAGIPSAFGHLLETRAKEFPRRAGGRPTKLDSPEVQKTIREQIKHLREPGVKLDLIFERIGRKYDTSASTIKRIWRGGARLKNPVE